MSINFEVDMHYDFIYRNCKTLWYWFEEHSKNDRYKINWDYIAIRGDVNSKDNLFKFRKNIEEILGYENNLRIQKNRKKTIKWLNQYLVEYQLIIQ